MNLTQALLLLIACILFPPLAVILLVGFLFFCAVGYWPSIKTKFKLGNK